MLESTVIVAPRSARLEDFAHLYEVTGGRLEIVSLPEGSEGAEASAHDAHLTRSAATCERASVILLLQGNPATDADGRHRVFVTQLYSRLSPAARRMSLSCEWQLAARSDTRDGLLSSAPPWGRSVGDIDIFDRDLLALIESRARPEPASEEPPFEALVMGDHPAKDDRLGFGPAVDELVSILSGKELELPLVVSIEGGWGCGKSSFMAQVRQGLRQKASANARSTQDPDPRGVVTVWFNAWTSEAQASLLSVFVLGLLEEVQRRAGMLSRGRNRLRLAMKRFDLGAGWKDLAKFVIGILLLLVAIGGAFASVVARDAVSLTTAKSSAGANAVTLFGVAVSAILGVGGIQQLRTWAGSPFSIDLSKHLREPGYEARTGFLDAFRQDLRRVIDVYVPAGTRVYVFIDDLDRCDPALVAELTQAISVLLGQDVPFVYIVGLDREKVSAAISAKHDKLAALVFDSAKSAPLAFGHAFLEKLIQLPYRIPTPTAEVLRKMVVRDDKAMDGSLAKAVQLAARFLEFNPRRIKQFANVLLLRARLLTQTRATSGGARRLTLYGLAKFIAIELRYPDFIRDIALEAGLLNALVLGAGRGTDTESYRRWSARSEVMDLLAATLPVPRRDIMTTDAEVSLVDVDFGSMLRLAPIASTPVRDAAEASPATIAVVQTYVLEYERLRRNVPTSPARTKTLDRLFDDLVRIQSTTPLARAAIEELFATGREGNRIAVLALCYGGRDPWSLEIALNVIAWPQSSFEDYQALRLVVQIWSRLDGSARRRAAQRVSRRRYLSPLLPRIDTSRWLMSEQILQLARDVEPQDEIVVELPNEQPIRIPSSDVTSFDQLTNHISYAMGSSSVAPLHYARDWALRRHGIALDHASLIAGRGPGQNVLNRRSLQELGVNAGDILRVELLRSDDERRPAETPTHFS